MKFLCWNLLVLKDTRTTVKSDYVISLNQNRLRNAVYLCINLSNISYESPHIIDLQEQGDGDPEWAFWLLDANQGLFFK